MPRSATTGTRTMLHARIDAIIAALLTTVTFFTVGDIMNKHPWMHMTLKHSPEGRTMTSADRKRTIEGLIRTCLRHFTNHLRNAYDPTNHCFYNIRGYKVVFTPLATDADVPAGFALVPYGKTLKDAEHYWARHRHTALKATKAADTDLGKTPTPDIGDTTTTTPLSSDLVAPFVSELLTIAAVHGSENPVIQVGLINIPKHPAIAAKLTAPSIPAAAAIMNDVLEYANLNKERYTLSDTSVQHDSETTYAVRTHITLNR